MLYLTLFLGLLGGIAVGLQGPLVSIMSQRVGTLGSIWIIHVAGMVGATFLLLLGGKGSLAAWRTVPWYVLGAGLLGLVVLSTISFTIPRIGAANSAILIIVAQLLVSVVLDHFGLLGIDIRRLDSTRTLGIGILILGTWLAVR